MPFLSCGVGAEDLAFWWMVLTSYVDRVQTHLVVSTRSKYTSELGMDQYLLIPFLGEWTSIYQLFWCSPGIPGLTHCQLAIGQVEWLNTPETCLHVPACAMFSCSSSFNLRPGVKGMGRSSERWLECNEEKWIPSGEHTKSNGKWLFIVDFPIKNGDFPLLC